MTVQKSDIMSTIKYIMKTEALFQRTYNVIKIITDFCNACKISGVTRQSSSCLIQD